MRGEFLASANWVEFTALATLAGSLALAAGGFAAWWQLHKAKETREEEMLLRLAAVYHDTIPVKRRIVAGRLLELIVEGRQARERPQDVPSCGSVNGRLSYRQRNALSDLMRFFETVSTVVGHLGRYRERPTAFSGTTGTAVSPHCTGRSPEDRTSRLLDEEAMPLHESNRVIRALLQIYDHAEERSEEALFGTRSATSANREGDAETSARSDSVSLEFGRYAAGYCCALLLIEGEKVPDYFRGWDKEGVLEFLRRERIAMSCDELSKELAEEQGPRARRRYADGAPPAAESADDTSGEADGGQV